MTETIANIIDYKPQILQWRINFPNFCFYCGTRLRPWADDGDRDKRTYDHVIPTSDGGEDRKFNKVPCCLKCNAVKANLPVEEFRARLQLYRKSSDRVLFFFELVAAGKKRRDS